MDVKDKVLTLSSLILEAKRENHNIVLVDQDQGKTLNWHKQARAKSYLSRLLFSSNSLEVSRLYSLSGMAISSESQIDNTKRKSKKKRHAIYDGDVNAESINKRNYYFNKKLERNY